MSWRNPKKYYLLRKWEPLSDTTNFQGWNFLRELIGHNFFLASVDWHNCDRKNLPVDYPYYFVKTEGANVDWVLRQAQRVQGTIFWMCQYRHYGTFDRVPNIVALPGIEWHYEFEGCKKDFSALVHKNIKHKVSTLTHRQTENKILALAAISEHMGLENCLISLHNNIQEKNVNNFEISNLDLQYYLDIYVKNFFNKTYEINNDIDLKFDSYNFHHPAYTDCAMNINNESFHYSQQHTRTNPGPVLTEKTIKCIMGECAFLNNGQFDVYDSLNELGFQFDYGFDLCYDKNSRDHDRMLGFINTIKNVSEYSADELYELTRESCLHNKNHVMSGDFYRQAEAVNHRSLEKILKIIQ
jgi:hypothetical protein